MGVLKGIIKSKLKQYKGNVKYNVTSQNVASKAARLEKERIYFREERLDK